MRAATTLPGFKKNWVQMISSWLWSVANRTCLKPTTTVSLLAVPLVRSGWIKWEGKQRLKDSIIYTFFFLFYHLSRSICFSLGKFKLFILTSSYNLLSKGFYFGLRKLGFFSPFCGINIVWLGKKRKTKNYFSCKQMGFFLFLQL